MKALTTEGNMSYKVNSNPEILDDTPVKRRDDSLTMPMKSLSKEEIHDAISEWLNDALEHYRPSDLYVFLKQHEEAVTRALEMIKSQALEDFQTVNVGAMEGTVLGHKVKVSFPLEWIYSREIDKLKERQKADLKSRQLAEQAYGEATRTEGTPRITVTLRP